MPSSCFPSANQNGVEGSRYGESSSPWYLAPCSTRAATVMYRPHA